MISVIICTFNRDRVFEATVNSFLNCDTDGIEHELLLVDNNSTDKTKEIGERFAARYPCRIHYMNEPSQGHPYAKNRGISESNGEIIAFADDDVFFSNSWLKAIASGFNRHINISCIGGRVTPYFENSRPCWIDDSLLCMYGTTQYGDHEKELRPPEIPIGCNMAFRRDIFEKIGGFHSSLGRKPGKLLSNDENHFLNSFSDAGFKTLYLPDAQVYHRIPVARTTRKWVLSRFYWQGISDIVMRQIGDAQDRRGVLCRQAIELIIVLLRQWKDIKVFLNPRNWYNIDKTINRQVNICYKFGKLKQLIEEVVVFGNRRTY